MKILLLLILSLAAPHLASCSLYKKYFDQPAPQPVCDTNVEHVAATGSIAITGDGDGMDLSHDIIESILVSCPDCRTRLDMGDVYPRGVSSKEDWEYKIASVDKHTEHIPGFRHFRALGNHSYQGDPQLQVDLSGQCYQYGVTDNITWKAAVIDTNYPSPAARKRAEKYLCGGKQRDLHMLVGHHPIYSHSSQKPRTSEQEATRAWLLSLVESKCVDIYLAGHDHHIEVFTKGDVFTHVQGGGGRGLRRVEKLPPGSGQLFIAKSHGFSVIRGRTLYLYNQYGLLLGEPIEIPRVR